MTSQTNSVAVQLCDVVEFLDARRQPVKAADRRPGPYPYYGANGQQGTIDDFIFDEPLVLLAEDGGHFFEPSRGIAYKVTGKSWVNNHAHVLRPRSVVDIDYLCLVLKNMDVTSHLTGTTRAKLTKAGASRIEIPLPPLAEQKRIAAILDAADALRAKRRETIKQLDALVQSVFLDTFGDPVTNPKGWDTRPFDKIGAMRSGGTPSKDRVDYWKGPIPWVSPKDMKRPIITDSIDHVSETAVRESRLQLLAPERVLIVVRGMILAHSFPVAVNAVPVVINQDMKAIDPADDVEVCFLAHCLASLRPAILSAVSSAGHGTKRFDRNAMHSVHVPIPPLPEQKAFREFVDIATKTRTQMGQFESESSELFASLQSHAFKGEL